MRQDLQMWQEFLHHQSAYARSFMDFSTVLQADEIVMYKNPKLGFGGICNKSWMFNQWPEGYIKKYNPSIEYLELFAVVVTVHLWINRFANRRVILFCDNQSVVHMINSTTSSCKNCMVLIRMLVLKCLTENVRVFTKYVKSKENVPSDLLSRLKIDAFMQLQSWDQSQTEIPEQFWPIQKLWVK